MEERTGARLLQRLPGRFALTPLGETILGNAERIEGEALAAERTITGRDTKLAGLVRMTTVDTLAARIVTPALLQLQRTHPGIIIELVPDTRTLSLSKREADIALRMTRFEGNEIVARRVGTLAMGVYAAHTYLDQAGLASDRLITVLEDQSHLPEAVWLRDLFSAGEIAFRSNSREAQLWATKSGGGVAILARYRADVEPDLVRLKTDIPNLTRDIWMGVHSDLRHMPRIRAVIDAVVSALQTNADALNPDG